MYRILIADDELLECRVLERMIRNHFPDVVVLSPVFTGTDLVEKCGMSRPDIIIADINMPGMSGLDALEVIHGKYPSVRILVVTAYGRFEYAKRAVHVGASDYILKPVKEHELCGALSSLIRGLDEEKARARISEEAQSLIEEYRETAEAAFLSDILLGRPQSAPVRRYLGMLPQPYAGMGIVCVRDRSGRGAEEHFLEQFRKLCVCCGIQWNGWTVICVFPPGSDSRRLQEDWIRDNVRCVLASGERFGELETEISPCRDDPEEFHGMLAEMLRKADPGESMEREDPAGRPEEDRAGKCSGEGLIRFEEVLSGPELETFRTFLGRGKREEALREAREYLRILPRRGVCPEQVQVKGILLADALFSVRTEEERARSPMKAYDYWMRIRKASGPEELDSCFAELFSSDVRKQPGGAFSGRYTKKSLSYMEEHFREELSLEAVAEKNHITSYYLSRLFKQEFHYTFIEILTLIRISNAIDLVIRSDLSVQEISQRCGYPNVSYFHRVFKKQTGMTAGRMREYALSAGM